MAATTPQEKVYYDQLFDAASVDDTGVLAGKDALPLLTASGLPQQTLGEVWAIADPDNNGFLTRDNWYKVGRLIGWLQRGDHTNVDLSLASKPGPFPTFKGYPSPPAALTMSPQVTGSTADGSVLPPLQKADRDKFTRFFVGCGPTNGLVGGDKARDVFLRSKLSYDKLGQIWNLADTQQRGALDQYDFIVGMWLIQSCMSNPSMSLPAVLPPGTYEQASGGRPLPNKLVTAQHTGPSSPIQRQTTGPLQPQVTGQSISAHPMSNPLGSSRQSTYTPTTPTSGGGVGVGAGAGSASWDITPEAKAASDRFFAQLDTQGKGVIEGDVAVPFMLQSQLDEASLASIWDLSDIRQEGKLDKDEFAVAMHLINLKLSGKEIPSSLPMSLIPPMLRASHGSQQTQQSQQPSAATRDLFDLFNDPPEPTTTAVPTSAFLPQPPSRRDTVQESRRPEGIQASHQPAFPAAGGAPRSALPADLLGDDAQETQAASLPDASADIGNKRNQLSNITRSVADLEKTRSDLEESATTSSAQLEKLTAELSSARSKHETETKAVADLRIRVGEQTTQLKQLQAEVISAESDLNAMRMEKDELEQALLHDKEEVRGLQKRMKELGDEKASLQQVLDKLKKDARQQKGMVSIAKKQLSTAEASRDAVQQDIRDAEQSAEHVDAQRALSPSLPAAAGVPLPQSPKTLSPEVTGASQRSLNPFERLSRNSVPRPNMASSGSHGSPSSPLGGAALAGAGLAAGATAGAFAASHASSDGVGAQDTRGTVEGSGMPDAFGVPVGPGESVMPAAASQDSFGIPGVPHAQETRAALEADGFGDSFGGAPSGAIATSSVPPSHDITNNVQDATDFDSAFADFDDGTPLAVAPSEMAGELNSMPAGAERTDVTEASEDVQHHGQEVSFPSAEESTSAPVDLPEAPIDVPGAPADVPGAPVDMPGHEHAEIADRTVSTPPIPSSNDTATPVADHGGLPMGAVNLAENSAPATSNVGEPESSDEEEGPEDIEGPRGGYGGAYPPAQSPPHYDGATDPSISAASEDHSTKIRRSAPPPPSARGSSVIPPSHEASMDPFGTTALPPTAFEQESTHNVGAEATSTPRALPSVPHAEGGLDPFGAPAAGTVAGSAGGQQSSQFDDEDNFDFSDLPPANPVQAPPAGQSSSAFDDEFANFDDEFETTTPSQTNSGSDNSNSLLQSYEVVPPQSGPTDVGGAPNPDAWGVNDVPNLPGSYQPGALSFDDAFGGFEPSPDAPQAAGAPSDYPVPAVSDTNTARPALPQRPSTQDRPQADDLDDVKKLCDMGFSRSLAIEALDANGYDFQKALNVLLVK